MELAKLNFFKKITETMPIGLCSLGLYENKNLKKNKDKKFYPRFFSLDKVNINM